MKQNRNMLESKDVNHQFETNNVVDNFASDVRKTSLSQHMGLLIQSELWDMRLL